jgi:RND superfamily putative drug exporter
MFTRLAALAGAASAVMRRPGRTAVGATLLMLVVAAPILGIHWTGIDAGVLPSSQSSRVVADTIARDVPGAGTSPLTIAVTAPASTAPAVGAYARELRGISGVLSVTPPASLGHDTWEISVGVRGAPASADAQALVAKVRAQPVSFPVAVGGQAASLADARAAVARTLPVALPLLAALTLIVLWLMTGSVTRTGAIVSAAAILLAVALGAFLTAKVVFLKELGLGAGMAVLIDAFLVRSLLAPAVMRVLGDAAWWSPRPLRRLHQRIGISESGPLPLRPRPVPSESSHA